MESLNQIKTYLKTELVKVIELLEYNNVPNEDKSLADGIKIVMVKDNLLKLVDYINEKTK